MIELYQPSEKRPSRDGSDTFVSLRDILFILFKFKWTIIVVLVAALFSTGVYLWLKDDVYEVSAKVLVKIGRENASPPSVISNGPTLVNQELRSINSEMEIIKSAKLLERVIDTLHLDRPPAPPAPPERLFPWLKYQIKRIKKGAKQSLGNILISSGLKEPLTPREAAMMDFISGLNVETKKDSNVVEVKLRVPFKEYSSVILNTLLQLYLERHLSAYKNEGVSEFFERQTSSLKSEMDDAETRLQRFKAKNDIVSIDEEKGMLIEQLMENGAAIDATLISIAETEAQLSELEALMEGATADDATENTGGDPESPFAFSGQGNEMKIGPSVHPSWGGEIYTMLKKKMVENRVSLQTLRHKLEELERDRNEYKAVLASLEGKSRELKAITRDVSLKEADYIFYKNKLEEARAADAMDTQGISNVVIIEPAIDPILPIGMRKVYIIGLSASMALIFALGLVFFMEMMDHAVYFPDQVERRLGVANLATIRNKRMEWKDGVPPGLDPEQVDAYMGLLMELGRKSGEARGKCLLVSASSQKEGTTTTVLNIAHLAGTQLGWKVLVVELNQRTPALDAVFSLNGAPGVSELINGRSKPPELVHSVRAAGFDVITLGSSRGVLSGTRLVEAAEAVFDELGAAYDLVLFDAPQVLPYTDFFDIASVFNRCLLVVEYGRTKEEVLDRVKAQMKRNGVAVSGTILNKRRYVIPEFIYRWL